MVGESGKEMGVKCGVGDYPPYQET